MSRGKIIKSLICMGAVSAVIIAGLPMGLHNVSAAEVTMNGVARNAASTENAASASKNAAANVLTEETAEPSILQRFPERMHEKVRHLLYNWAYPRETVPGMEEIVEKLKNQGYGVYLLSNASKAQHQYWPLIPVSRLFDGKLISCDVRTVKPCPRIYELFTEKYGLKPEECLFVDDSTANVAAAIACGWQGIVFHGDAEELKKKMNEKGIIISAGSLDR